MRVKVMNTSAAALVANEDYGRLEGKGRGVD